MAIREILKKAVRKGIRMLPEGLKHIAYHIILEEKFFSRSNTVKEFFYTEWILEKLKRQGFSPAMVIDGGAYVGKWTRIVRRVFPAARVLMVEANPEKESCLQKVKKENPGMVDYSMSLLGAESGKMVDFYRMETGSSVFEEMSNVPREVERLPVRTLDEIAVEKRLPPVDLLKLDVQGYEIEVLKGAKKILREAEVVLLEVAFQQYNKGAPLIRDVLNFMDGHGFVADDIGALFRYGGDNTLLQVDLFLVKKESASRAKKYEF